MGSDLSRETMLENVQLSVDGGRALTDDAVRAPPSFSRLALSSPPWHPPLCYGRAAQTHPARAQVPFLGFAPLRPMGTHSHGRRGHHASPHPHSTGESLEGQCPSGMNESAAFG